MTTMMSHPAQRCLLLLMALLHFSSATISNSDEGITTEHVHMAVQPDSKHIHFLEVQLEAPGYIDLSGLEFSTIDTGHDAEAVSEEVLEDEEDDDAIAWDDDDWHLPEKKTTHLDVVVVYIPDNCPVVMSKVAVKSSKAEDDFAHCDFTEVGVGRKYSEVYGRLEEPSWCCTEDEVSMDLCDGSVASFGSLMMNTSIFEGSHRYIEVPPYGMVTQNIRYGNIQEVEHSGKYAIIFANCYQGAGREMVIMGDLKVKSSGTAPTRFNTAMKSFAKKSLERTEEETNNNNNESSSGYGWTLAILVFGLAGAAYIARDNVERLKVVIMSRGYNTLELSEMDGHNNAESNYVPISPSW